VHVCVCVRVYVCGNRRDDTAKMVVHVAWSGGFCVRVCMCVYGYLCVDMLW